LLCCVLFVGLCICDKEGPQKESKPKGSTPHFIWSQTLGSLELIVKIPEPTNVDIEFEVPNLMIIRARSGKSGGLYRLVLRFYGDVDGLDAVWDLAPSQNAIVVEIPKSKNVRKPWPRLLKSKESYRLHLGVHWDKWIDFENEALKALMNRRFQTGEESPQDKENYRLFEEWVRDAGLIDNDDDLDAAIEDLWRERLEKQEKDYLDFQNYEFLRKDLHDLLQKYPYGSDLSKMSRTDSLRLDHLIYHYGRIENEADALRQSRSTESGMFESEQERNHLRMMAEERRSKKEL